MHAAIGAPDLSPSLLYKPNERIEVKWPRIRDGVEIVPASLRRARVPCADHQVAIAVDLLDLERTLHQHLHAPALWIDDADTANVGDRAFRFATLAPTLPLLVKDHSEVRANTQLAIAWDGCCWCVLV
eukprot:927126-Prymnesium_polylepis.1